MERLGRDVLGILDRLGIARVDWCGLSMGGMVGQWLGAHAPDRVRRLILSNTPCHYLIKDLWDERIATARNGLAPLVEPTMARWFTAPFMAAQPDIMTRMRAMMLATPVAGYVANCEAVRAMDHRDLLPRIATPTLVIAGRHDMATPLAAGTYIQSRIPGAALAILAAGHISNIEQASMFTATVLDFLAEP